MELRVIGEDTFISTTLGHLAIRCFPTRSGRREQMLLLSLPDGDVNHLGAVMSVWRMLYTN